MLWHQLVTITNSNTSNKSLSRISSGDYKRTRQEVSAGLLPYLYKLHMVYAMNNYFCPNVHVLSISALCIYYEVAIINFIQLVSLQPVNCFSQTKLCWKASNEGYLHICGMYKSDNKWLRYQAISSCKSFVCWYLTNGWMDSHNWTCVGKCSSNHFQWYIIHIKALGLGRDTSISM